MSNYGYDVTTQAAWDRLHLPMTPNELRGILQKLAWSQKYLGRYLGVGERLSRYWASGQIEVPVEVRGWLRMLYAGKLYDLPHRWAQSETFLSR